jgi:hypothetical protein
MKKPTMQKKFIRNLIISSVTLFSFLTSTDGWCMYKVMSDELMELRRFNKCIPLKKGTRVEEHQVDGRKYNPNECPWCTGIVPRMKVLEEQMAKLVEAEINKK